MKKNKDTVKTQFYFLIRVQAVIFLFSSINYQIVESKSHLESDDALRRKLPLI